MILGAFGDSFLFGSDLQDCHLINGSSNTWPALICNKLNLDYKCYAWPGIGNRQILNSLLANYQTCDIAVINWTWIDRFDYVGATDNKWYTILPAKTDTVSEYYYKHIHSELLDKLNVLGVIYQAICLLESCKKPYLMTYMDKLLLDKTWHCPKEVSVLQDQVYSKLHTMDGLSFLDWTKHQNFPISNTWHPLEESHQKAAEYWLPTVIHLLNTHAKEDYLHAFI